MTPNAEAFMFLYDIWQSNLSDQDFAQALKDFRESYVPEHGMRAYGELVLGVNAFTNELSQILQGDTKQ